MLMRWFRAIAVSTEAMRGSILPALKSAIAVESSVTFLFSSRASVCADGAPPLPSAPNWLGSMGSLAEAAWASATWSGVIALNSPATWAAATGSAAAIRSGAEPGGSAACASGTPSPLGIAGRLTRDRTCSTWSGTPLRWETKSVEKS
jgi:hypothetical protein